MYGVGFDPGNMPWDGGSESGCTASGTADGSAVLGGGNDFVGAPAAFILPPPHHVGAWLAALVSRDGEAAVLKALLENIPEVRVMAAAEAYCEKYGT